MDEIIKKFIDCYVPICNCNLKCNYCYISTWENRKKNENSMKIPFSANQIRKALSKKRWGGPLMLNFCAAGETLLSEEIVTIVQELLDEGHYCMIVTNGTITPKFNQLAQFSAEQRKRLFIKFSYHHLELKKLKMLDIFFSNVKKMHASGISYTVEVTPSDEYIPYIDEIKEICKKNTGALPHVTVCRIENGDVPLMSKLSREEFIKTWSSFKSDLFDFKIKIFGEKRKEFCYAGSWSYSLSLLTGELKQCYRGKKLQNIFEDIDSSIKEEPIGCNCVDAHCWNGHAFLAFGDIPELDAPTFEQERNRQTDKGPWITKQMADFMSTKLFNDNEQLSDDLKQKFNKKSKGFYNKQKIKKTIKRFLNNS